MDIDIEQDDLNQKFLTSLVPEWLILEEDREKDFYSRENYRQGLKEEEQAPKALIAIDGVGWVWSFMENEEENHALVTDEEAPTEFALMAKSSTDNEVFDNSLCSKACKKNTNSLNSKIIELSKKLGDTKNMMYHYKLVESKANRIENLTNKLETLKKEKEGLDSKLTGFKTASKDLDNLLESLRSNKNKEGLGYSDVPPPPAQVYFPPKKDMSWTGLLEFADDTITYYSRPSPAIESNSDDLQNRNPSVTEIGVSSSTILSKPAIKFVKAVERPTGTKTDKVETVKKSSVKYAEMYKKNFKKEIRNFITKIENLKDLKVKIIRCDNRGEFRNKEMNDYCSRKGIKREFSNARTPQQNGVAERRNRTLIEAARNMLADAKLPITFWTEAVNTACYVQNRVLVNKSQNKTPYELFNSRTPAIGFLKPFGCHVIILNTLDHLGKFKAKGDEGYFIGYSMSSKAFRVFIKRTKRVKENLHVDFLENKAIEKGAGPNWLFDIDSLTNSMNYVPVMVVGTNHTNFSGTKEAACQDEKKHVSSLRYVALPNWIHEAHLESSTSNAQDACNANAPERNGNSNPTATSTNALANQMETQTVETPVPTISSPVLIACLNDSPEPSSDTRLISKRVTNQDDTPSLNNILTSTNRFEDILRVTTNTDDTNGVEANLGNTEYNISAGLTPTFRINKDHPKSLVDCPKRVRPIGTKWVLKNKKDKRGIVIKNKARLVAQGHTQEEGIDYDEVFTPVVRIEAVILFLDYASFMGFTVYPMDVKSVFLYDTIDEEVYVMQPPGFQDPEFPARVYKLKKAMYGLHQAPRAWHQVIPKECYLHTVKRIFRYLKGHPELGLWYPKESPFDLVAYSDSDYSGATQDRKSTTRG
nr:ribonuclease H-like domain-containing protein [Tanacetum cinerariifolium]